MTNPNLSRRDFLKISGAFSLAAAAAPLPSALPEPKIIVSYEARQLHDESLVVDLHADTFLWVSMIGYDIARRHHPVLPTNPLFNQVDIPRMKEGGLKGQGFGIVVRPRAKLPMAPKADAMLDTMHAEFERNKAEMELALSGSALYDIYTRKKIAAFIGMEGAHPLDGNLDNLRHFYQRGVRYLTMVHFTANELGSAVNHSMSHEGGLTSLGIEAVQRMNELGMLVDVAHLNPAGIDDVLKYATQPVIDSHTGLNSVYEHYRNLEDRHVIGIAETGGVIGIIFYPYYLTGHIMESLQCVIRHVMRAVELVGPDHVALGSDFDGFVSMPLGLKDVSCLPRLTQLLLEQGLAPDDIKKILGENFRRVFTQVCG